MPPHGWINLHFSLLPAWRGAAPVQAAIAAGDAVTGATTFLIEPALDSGPVYGVVTETIRANDTAGELLTRLAESGAHLLESTLDGIADGRLQAVPQPADGVTVAPRSPWTRPASGGICPPTSWTAGSAPSPRIRAPGRSSATRA